MASSSIVSLEPIEFTVTLMAVRQVTVSFHRPGETFKLKALKSIIEKQAKWTADELKR